MKRLAILIGVPLAIMAAGHAPNAWACSCVAGTSQADFKKNADAVFVGTVVEADKPAQGEISGQNISVWFERVAFEKGDLGAEPLEVETADNSATCGYDFQIGNRYRVYTHGGDGQPQTGLCSGNEDLGPDPQYGKGTAPDRTDDENEPDEPVVNEPPAEDDDEPLPEPTTDTIGSGDDQDVAILENTSAQGNGGSGLGIAIGLGAATLGSAGIGFYSTRKRPPVIPS